MKKTILMAGLGILMAVGCAAAEEDAQKTTDNNGSTSTVTAKYAYVTNYTGNTVSQYTVEADGTLTPMATPTIAASSNPDGIAVDPSGQYLYVANNSSSNVSQFTIGADGSLTQMIPASIAAGAGADSVAVDPTGKYVYVSNQSVNTISQYTIGADGTLTQNGSSSTEATPMGIVIDPTGKYLYVANSGSNTISQYNIETDGTLTVMGTPSVAAVARPQSISIDSSGRYLYAANLNSGGLKSPSLVSQYTIGADGALTAMATPTVNTGTAPITVSASPADSYAYVLGRDADMIHQFAISGDGSLTNLDPIYIATLGNVSSVPVSISVDPSGKYAYVANYVDNNISQYTIGADGTLSEMATPTVGAGTGPTAIVVVGYVE